MPDCQHERFEARVDTTRLTSAPGGPVTGYTADVRIRCAQCGMPFRFLGLKPGASPTQPMVSVDATEARLPIAPADSTPSMLHRIAGARERFDA